MDDLDDILDKLIFEIEQQHMKDERNDDPDDKDGDFYTERDEMLGKMTALISELLETEELYLCQEINVLYNRIFTANVISNVSPLQFVLDAVSVCVDNIYREANN